MHVHLRFYEELNDFIKPGRQKREFAVDCPNPRSVKDLIESQGVPHTEVDLVLVNGKSAGFDHLIHPGDRISVYPKFESLNIRKVSKLDRPPLRRIAFVADVHLGKLVKHLRLLGFDCLYNPEWSDRELAEISADNNRILLTRDRGLLKRAIVDHGIYLRSDQPEEQTKEVIRRLDLADRVHPVSRCLACNGKLVPTAKNELQGRIPKHTYANIDEYLQCQACGKVFWRGTHWKRLEQIINHIIPP